MFSSGGLPELRGAAILLWSGRRGVLGIRGAALGVAFQQQLCDRGRNQTSAPCALAQRGALWQSWPSVLQPLAGSDQGNGRVRSSRRTAPQTPVLALERPAVFLIILPLTCGIIEESLQRASQREG